MLKRKFLSVLLPALTVVGIVGSGFSAWYFDDITALETSRTVGLEITNRVDSLGTLEVTTTELPTKMTLDQGGHNNKTALDKGISFDNENDIHATFKFDSEDVFNYLESANVQVQLTATVKLDTKLANYVKYTHNFFTDEGAGTYTFVNQVATYSSVGEGMAVPLKVLGDLTFEYKEGKKPTTAADYEAMKTALQDVTTAVTFSFKAEIVDKTGTV